MKQNILNMLAMILVFTIIFSIPVYADVSVSFPGEGNNITAITNGVNKIWGTVIPIVQMLAFGAIVFSGVRYMFASSDKRADIKKSLMALVIGAILVFATSLVVEFVVNAGNEVIVIK